MAFGNAGGRLVNELRTTWMHRLARHAARPLAAGTTVMTNRGTTLGFAVGVAAAASFALVMVRRYRVVS